MPHRCYPPNPTNGTHDNGTQNTHWTHCQNRDADGPQEASIAVENIMQEKRERKKEKEEGRFPIIPGLPSVAIRSLKTGNRINARSDTQRTHCSSPEDKAIARSFRRHRKPTVQIADARGPKSAWEAETEHAYLHYGRRFRGPAKPNASLSESLFFFIVPFLLVDIWFPERSGMSRSRGCLILQTSPFFPPLSPRTFPKRGSILFRGISDLAVWVAPKLSLFITLIEIMLCPDMLCV